MAVFTDSNGVEWQLRLTTPVLMRVSRECNVTLSRVMTMEIRLDEIVEMIWIACAGQASERKCSRDDFLDGMGPECLSGAVHAAWDALREAFPQLGDSNRKGGDVSPLAEAAEAALGKFAI